MVDTCRSRRARGSNGVGRSGHFRSPMVARSKWHQWEPAGAPLSCGVGTGQKWKRDGVSSGTFLNNPPPGRITDQTLDSMAVENSWKPMSTDSPVFELAPFKSGRIDKNAERSDSPHVH